MEAYKQRKRAVNSIAALLGAGEAWEDLTRQLFIAGLACARLNWRSVSENIA